MTNNPTGWYPATIGDLLLRIEAGKSFRCESRPAAPDEWGVIKVSAMTWGEFLEDENKAVLPGAGINPIYEIKSGDILVSRANTEAYVGAPVLVERCRTRLLLSDKSLRLVPSARLSVRWLYYLLSSPAIRREISLRATGTKDSMRNISQQNLASIPVMVPPVEEQHRIAAALDDHLSRLDAAAASVSSAARRVARLGQAILHRLVSPGTPGTWSRYTLADVVTSVRNGMYVSRPGVEPDGVPILRISAVRRLNLDLSDLRYSARTLGSVRNEGYLLEAGDLLFTRYNGNPEYVGACAVVPHGIEPLTYPDKLIRVTPDKTFVDPQYLAMTCSAGDSRAAIRDAVKTTAGQAGISGGEIKRVPLHLPDLDEQRRRAAEFRVTDEAIRRLDQAVKSHVGRGLELRRSLLSEALAGKLVPQDPADEPASVLLDRVSAERAAQSRTRPRRRRPMHAVQEETLI